MSEEYVKEDINRRGFLKAAVVTAVAATVTGTTAGLLLKETGQALVTLPQPTLPETLPYTSGSSLNSVELQSQLAAFQAENTRLQVRLSASESQLELARRNPSAQNPAIGQENAALEAWRLQLDEANAQVAGLSEEVSVLQGLVSLYEQLDAVDLAAIAGGGLSAVAGILGDLAEEAPTVTEGIRAGQEALTEFEEQIPQVKEGRQWLATQINVIGQSYQAIEHALQNSRKVAGTFLSQLNEWVQDILKWLPFGIGETAATILDKISDLLAEIPETVDGLQTKLATPLDAWLEEEDGELRLQRRLIKPVRDDALNRASQTVSQVQTLQSVYQTQLAEPVEVATDHQQALRARIDEYRQTYLV